MMESKQIDEGWADDLRKLGLEDLEKMKAI